MSASSARQVGCLLSVVIALAANTIGLRVGSADVTGHRTGAVLFDAPAPGMSGSPVELWVQGASAQGARLFVRDGSTGANGASAVAPSNRQVAFVRSSLKSGTGFAA